MFGPVAMRPNCVCVWESGPHVPLWLCLSLSLCLPPFPASAESLPLCSLSFFPECAFELSGARIRGDPREEGRWGGEKEVQVRSSKETGRGKEADPGPGREWEAGSFLSGERMLPAAWTRSERRRLLPAAAGARVPVWRLRGRDSGCEAHSNGALRRLDCSSQLGRGGGEGAEGRP